MPQQTATPVHPGPRWPAGLLLLLAAWLLFGPIPDASSAAAWDYETHIPYGEAGSVDVIVRAPSGTLAVSSESTALAHVGARYPWRTATPITEYVEDPRRPGVLSILLPVLPDDGLRSDAEWELDFGTDVLMTLTADLGDADASFDLSRSTFGRVQLVAGASDVEIDLRGREEGLSIWIVSGSGRLHCVLPEDVGASVHVDTTETVLFDHDEFTVQGSALVNSAAATATPVIEIDAEAYTGRIELDLW